MLPNTASQSAHIGNYNFVDFQSLVIWDPWRTGITDVVRESAYQVIGLKTPSPQRFHGCWLEFESSIIEL